MTRTALLCVDIKAWDVVALTPLPPFRLLLWLLLAPLSLARPSHRHSGSKHGPLTPPSSLCACVSVSASLPVKTCFVSWAQLYTCYRLTGRLAFTTFTLRTFFVRPGVNACFSRTFFLVTTCVNKRRAMTGQLIGSFFFAHISFLSVSFEPDQ